MTVRNRERVAAELASQYEAGVSLRQLARKSGLSYSSVRTLLIEHGVTIRRQGRAQASIRST